MQWSIELAQVLVLRTIQLDVQLHRKVCRPHSLNQCNCPGDYSIMCNHTTVNAPVKPLTTAVVKTAFHPNRHGWQLGLALATFLCLAPSGVAWAATAPALGSTSTYGIVSSTFTNTLNPTVINGDVCYTIPPTTTPTTITGVVVTPCNTQIGDQGTALSALDSQLGSCTTLGAAVDLSLESIGGGTPGVIPPGCYSSTGAMSIGSTLTLSGSGVYIFRPGAGSSAAALNTAANSTITLNGACAADVFWAPTSATTLGANSTFAGTIIDAAGITMGHLASLTGRALAAGGTVTTDANTITIPSVCAAASGPLALAAIMALRVSPSRR
jgi:hypothetical protein